ncbi:hypothetical protein ABVN80_18725 [Acinetobacter baumannii]
MNLQKNPSIKVSGKTRNGAAGHVIDAIEEKFKALMYRLNLLKFIMKRMALSQMASP